MNRARARRPPRRAPTTAPSALRADVRGRADRRAEVAAAEVVLRRPGQRAVRARSPGCRSTTRPAPSGRSWPSAPPRSPARPARRRWSSWAPARRRRPGCCWTRCTRSGTLAQFVPLDVSSRALREAADGDRRRLPGAARARRRRRLHPAPGPLPGGRPRGWWPSSAARSATCCPAERAAFLAAAARGAGRRRRGCCSAPTWSRTRRCWSPAYDDAAGVTAEFNRNVLRVLNRELGADFDPDAFDHVARLGRRAGVDRDAAAGRRRACGSAMPDAGPDGGLRAPARSCAPRSRRSSAARACEARAAPRPGSRSTHWWTDPQGRFALSLARAV